ncbi:MAG: polyprenyl synthetase family protein [Myxococcales bacterium]|nr:polyprenyl synthetase family protein [Myxococcales bacterium]
MAPFALAPYLEATRVRVEALLQPRLSTLFGRAPEALLEAMRYSVLGGGKRLRPTLCLSFADAVSRASGGGGEAADDAACAVEWVHAYSLIHDDLPAMDDDDLRRGRPTSHKVFGEAMAILAGDALLTEAFALLTREATPLRASLCAELAGAAGAAGMVGGQVLDIAADRPADRAHLERMHGLKTGALIRASCRMGALAAGARESELRLADAYGRAVGLAFQIADDVLDVTASREAMGKPTRADAARGRPTFPAVLGLEASRAMAREQAELAAAAIRPLEPEPGPLAMLARYAAERDR